MNQNKFYNKTKTINYYDIETIPSLICVISFSRSLISVTEKYNTKALKMNGLNKLNKLPNLKVNNQSNFLTFLYFFDIFFFDISFHLGHKTNLDLTIGRLRKEDVTKN
jgi:hypothetical protein